MKIILIILTLLTNIYASSLGSLSLIVLKDGKALKNQEFKIIKSDTSNIIKATTDEDGYFFTKLASGKYQIQLLAREHGKAQAFIKKSVIVESSKESQIIISLKNDNSLAFIDSEAPASKTIAKNDTIKVVKNGTLLITLTSSEDKKKISNATIFVKGTNVEAISDAKGFVEINLAEGKHTISIIHQDFSAQTIKVDIIAKEAISKLVELTPSSMQLAEFVVLAPHIEGSVAASISEARNNDTVGNVLGSEEFGKNGDSTVSSALKRVSGITIVGGKYVYVRGLGDRYSTVMLNDLHIPSPQPTKRVVPLDIFPTSVVESITIQKSYSGDLPASFGGGTVLIKSKNIPKDGEDYASLGLEILVNSTTGNSAITNSSNATPLPSSVLNGGNFVGGTLVTSDVIKSRTLNRQATTIAPGTKFEASFGKSYKINDDISIGGSATVYYKNFSDNNSVDNNKYFYDINSKKIFHDNNTKTDITSINTQLATMLNLGMDYFGNNKIKYTLFTTKSTSDTTNTSSIVYTGNLENREKTYYEYVEKEIVSNQLSGENEIKFSSSTDGYFDNLKIDWALESSTALRNEPGTVETNYLYQSSGLNWDRKTWYYYFKLNDSVSNYRADFSLPFVLNGNDNYTKAGIFIYNKSRDFDSRRFKVLSNRFTPMPENIDTIYTKYASNLDFSASYINTDSYQAIQEVNAFYLKQLISVTHDLDVVASLRQENSSQQLTDAAGSYDPLVTSNLFPSLGVTYRFSNDDMQLRFAYAQTISRPDFREFSNSRYKDPVTENIVFGNPDLKATYINHLDLKYEWYLSSDEIFSVALFSKEFINPIEKVVKLDDSQDNIFLETYQNADLATSYGVEVDYRKRFGFISESFEKLLFSTNVALIESNIKLNSDPNNDFTKRLTSNKRAMQGQSPYVLNLSLGYDDADEGNSALFLFNQIGERIVSLGTDQNKDIYQQPFAKLDFIFKWNISPKEGDDVFAYDIRFRAKNLLNSEVKFTQGDLTTASTYLGRFYSLKLNINY